MISTHRQRVANSLEPLESRIAPASFLVNSLLDNGAAGTLRTEINLANTAGGSNTITFAPGLHGNIVLTSAEGGVLSITDNLAIKGPGGNKIIIQGDGSAGIFNIDSHSVKLSGLAMFDGSVTGNGGAISSLGPLAISGCTITGSTAAGVGGGIYDHTTGAFSLKDSLVTGNSTTGGSKRGGGAYIAAEAGMLVSHSVITGNNAAGSGGGIELNQGSGGAGNIVITGSLISGNIAGDRGGGAHILDYSTGGGQVQISSSTFTGNKAATYGGGIYLKNNSNKPASLKTVVISANTATANDGGGIQDLSTEAVVIQSSRLVGNTAGEYGGGIESQGVHPLTIQNSSILDNEGVQLGGIESSGETFTLIASVVSGNHTTDEVGGLGVVFPTGPAKITGSTISNNTSGTFAGGAYFGGSEAVTISSTTVTGNTALSGAGGGLDIKTSSGSILLSNDTISHNDALGTSGGSTGGGVNLGGSATFSIVRGSIKGNLSTGDGGGVYVGASAAGLIKDVIISANQAPAGGGFAHASGSTGIVHITEPSLITGNVGSLGKADIYGESITP